MNLKDAARQVLDAYDDETCGRKQFELYLGVLNDALAQPEQEPVAMPRFNCWSTNDGDSWFDDPADADVIYDTLGDEPQIGDEFEIIAGWQSVTAKYRVTKVGGDGDCEVECISHPQENTTPPQRTAAEGEDTQRGWVGLTDEDKKQIAKEANYNWEMTTGEYAERIGRLTEAKLKEKNNVSR